MCDDNTTTLTINSVSLSDAFGCSVTINLTVSGNLGPGQWNWNCGSSNNNIWLGAPNYTGSIGYYQDTGGNNCDNFVPSCSTFDRDGISCAFSASLLPVDLTDFRVEPSKNGALLKWTTSQETNNEGFEIQRKTTHSDWINIGWINGKGNSEVVTNYEYEDRINEIAYYRLQQIDTDGSNQYSPIVAFQPSTNQSDLQLFPTLSSDIVSLKNITEYDYLTLLNINGTLIQQFEDSEQFQFDVSNLPNGPYFVLVKTNNTSMMARFIKE